MEGLTLTTDLHVVRGVNASSGYVTTTISDEVVLCDPLTGLASYNSFENFVVARFPEWARCGMHLAIGDVDDLRGYVTSQNQIDSAMFGHLAGNACMRAIGSLVREWHAAGRAMRESVCGTFGGDEVIVAGIGGDHQTFHQSIRQLAQSILEAAPRPCSFVVATLKTHGPRMVDAGASYRAAVSTIDRALFRHKSKTRAKQVLINGDIVDLGVI